MASSKFKFHVLGLSHLPTKPYYNSCAFSQKIIKLCHMLMSLGHEVYFYGAEGSEVECTEFIQIQTLANIRKAWGDPEYKGTEELGYDWRSEYGFNFRGETEVQMGALKYFAVNAVFEIERRAKADHFILLQGGAHKVISETLGDRYMLKVEPGIGYRHCIEKFRAYESFFAMHYSYGMEAERDGEVRHGRFYDRVIPNYFDLSLYPFSDKKDDYFCFVGRLVGYKGVHIAVKTAHELKKAIKIAGQGGFESIVPEVEFVGYADSAKRAELLSHAKATFVPTIYLEPFGGVAIESMLCGTPVITTNYGVFPEYVINGFNGYRCNMFYDFVEAGKKLWDFKPEQYKAISDWARERYDMEVLKWEYQTWFSDLYSFYESVTMKKEDAWYTSKKPARMKERTI